MTVTSTSNRQIFLGNGATSTFTYNFIMASALYAQAIFTDAQGNQTVLSPGQYTLTINPAIPPQVWGVGGTITYQVSGAPIPSGATLTLERIVPDTQLNEFPNQGVYDATTVEQTFDYEMMAIQQNSDALSRAVTLNPADPVSMNGQLIAAAARANLVLGFDALGALTYYAPTGITPPVRVSNVPYGVDTGSANAYIVPTTSPAISALNDGQVVLVKIAHANTGASTLNVAGLGAVAIQDSGGAALAAGELAVNDYVVFIYASGLGVWQYLGHNVIFSGAPGTGSVARPLNQKGADLLTVKDYGAKGDGSTDDTTALTHADAQNALVFPAGTYRMGSSASFSSQAIFLPGASLSIDSGKTATFTQQPTGTRNSSFFGAGAVAGAGLDQLSVFEWFTPTQVQDVVNRGETQDVTVPIQAAINAVQGTGKVLFFPAGAYKITQQIFIVQPIVLKGDSILKDWTATASGVIPPTPTCGTVMCDYVTPGGGNVAVFHVGTSDFYMENFDFISKRQTTPGGGWTPVATVDAVQVASGGAPLSGNCPTFRDIMVRGMTRGVVCLGSIFGLMGRVDIRGLYGQTWGPLLYLDGLGDIPHIKLVHYWNFYSIDTNIVSYNCQNSTCVYFGRADSPIVEDLFGINLLYGIVCADGASGATGSANFVQLANVGFDGTRNGIASLCTDSASNPTIQLVNFVHYGYQTAIATADSSVCITDGPGTRPMSIWGTNIVTSSLGHEGVRLANSGSEGQFNNLEINTWNLANASSNALYAGTGATFYIGTAKIFNGQFGASATGGAGTFNGTYYGISSTPTFTTVTAGTFKVTATEFMGGGGGFLTLAAATAVATPNLAPSADNTYNLGGASNTWATVYAHTFKVSSTEYVGGAGGFLTLAAANAVATPTVAPSADNTYDCGTSANAWAAMYTHSSPTPSDERQKQNITPLANGLAVMRALRPVSYEWRGKQSHQRHGFIAQATAAALAKLGVAGVVLPPKTDADKWAIEYGDLWAFQASATDELARRLEAAEALVAALSEKLVRIESRLGL